MDNNNTTTVYCDVCTKIERDERLYIKSIVAFREYRDFNGTCKWCGNKNCKKLQITRHEISPIQIHAETMHDSVEQFINQVLEFDELKRTNPKEFEERLKPLEEFKVEELERRQRIVKRPVDPNAPKCPTCGSTNIKKISGTKRLISIGFFGLASSNVGKTMQCNDCCYKF